MMTAAVLLMAAVPGRQRLAAQEAGGKQGGVMELNLQGGAAAGTGVQRYSADIQQ